MEEIGVIHGRFQVLHDDHLKYLMAGKARCRHLIVGITNPDPSMTIEDLTDPQRSNPIENPLTYYERYVMIEEALEEAGFTYVEFSVVPFPINRPELLKYYVPLDCAFFLTIYDEWGRRKLEQLRDMGLKTEILWEKPIEEKGLIGSDIRKRMAAGEVWEHLVPPSTRHLMIKWDIPQRLRNLRE